MHILQLQHYNASVTIRIQAAASSMNNFFVFTSNFAGTIAQ